ncbi:MAG: hypothetical protein F2934_00350 [Actinobacteria bacterium]|uniref:Unannotated protein n=1 Tax=freshwater metagenome TaxID=449393 RepID=A0A6J7E835_9ZZZZ|nr:hypothetical protein [Actinomycetota bacterium]MSY12152.1 hypothetical protein [Actinomycetota bacterium]MSZ04332.1 hypothetical protein [Actinomycetota bacterium]MTB05563.1 hypothetical protein [Actinomycetota bacterium]
MAPRARRRPTLLVLLGTGLALALSACGGAAASTAKVASLSSGPAGTDATASTEPLSDQASIVKFASCLRDEGLDVPDPKFDANGNLDGRIFERGGAIDPRSDNVRAAIETCRGLVGNVRLGPGGGRFNPEQMQAAFNDFTSCLRSQGLDVEDVTFGRPGSNGNGNGGNGASGTEGPRDGFGPPPGETGPRDGQGFNPTRRLMRQLNLDETDPKVTAAVAACQPALTASITNAAATTTTVAN